MSEKEDSVKEQDNFDIYFNTHKTEVFRKILKIFDENKDKVIQQILIALKHQTVSSITCVLTVLKDHGIDWHELKIIEKYV